MEIKLKENGTNAEILIKFLPHNHLMLHAPNGKKCQNVGRIRNSPKLTHTHKHTLTTQNK